MQMWRTSRRMQAQRGFTLLEILLAMVLLFSALAIVSDGFQASRLNSQQAAENITMLAPLPLILDAVRQQIRETKGQAPSGDGSINQVKYSYSAELLQQAAPPAKYQVETGTELRYQPRFMLYQVRLTLNYRQRSRVLEFREVAWSESRLAE